MDLVVVQSSATNMTKFKNPKSIEGNRWPKFSEGPGFLLLFADPRVDGSNYGRKIFMNYVSNLFLLRSYYVENCPYLRARYTFNIGTCNIHNIWYHWALNEYK